MLPKDTFALLSVVLAATGVLGRPALDRRQRVQFSATASTVAPTVAPTAAHAVSPASSLAFSAAPSAAHSASSPTATPAAEEEWPQPPLVTTPDKPVVANVPQLAPPPVADLSKVPEECQITIMPESFFHSWDNRTFKGEYTPPENCKGPWKNVILNFKAIGDGNTFDRRGTMWLGETMIWEFSTAEPNNRVVEYDYSKEVGQFNALWAEGGDFYFDLPTDDKSPGINAAVTATFIQGDPEEKYADYVVPIAYAPGRNFLFPQVSKDDTVKKFTARSPSIERATAQIFATGTLDEEFWEHQVDNKFISQFSSNTAWHPGVNPNGPYREIQFLIDDKVAGVYMPFPNVYSGGLNYLFWKNEVAIGTYDIPSYTINLDPWLHLLADGKEHTFGMNVVSENEKLNNATGGGWFVAANVKIWEGEEGGKTTGEFISNDVDAKPAIDATGGETDDKKGFKAHVGVSRKVDIKSKITRPSDKGVAKEVSWSQDLNFTHDQTYITATKAWSVSAVTSGTDSDSSGKVLEFKYPYSYANNYDDKGQFNEVIDHSWEWTASSSRDFSPLGVKGQMSTQQKGTGSKINRNPNAGHTKQIMKFTSDGKANGVTSYERTLEVDHTKIISDDEKLNGRSITKSA